MIRPTPFIIRVARISANLTQADAAQLVHLSSQSRWAEYEAGKYPPDPARWDLFLILTGQHPDWQKLKPRKRAKTPDEPAHGPPGPAG